LDTDVALRCAELHVPDRMSDHDAIVAATAPHHGMIVVTRNTVDFERSGVRLLNPWIAPLR
jgi:predicted nucleic acid-binding protein